jgi:hypothetical protein
MVAGVRRNRHRCRATLPGVRAATADPTYSPSTTYLICAAAWFVPGGGHLWLGRRQKGLTFLVALTLMFAAGLWLEGQLFPFDLTQPLVALAAFADIGIGLPYLVAAAAGAGDGRVVAVTYEYGNAFLIVAGLMNMLVVLDAFDIAQGRK